METTRKLNYLEGKLFEYLIIGLLIILYAPLVIHWYDGWLNKSISIEHEYFSHGMIGLPFAVYITWLKRKQWQRLENTTNPWGGFFLSIAILFYLTGVSELVNLSLPIILIGICFWIKGLPGLKLLGFPLILVLLATPNSLPYLITPLTLPLQKFIATTAAFILIQFGIDVSVQEIYLAVGERLVEVAPYCAGLKMLFTSIYVSLMLLYWTDNHRNKQKASILLIGAIILSVTANIIRNTLLTFFHGTAQDELFHWLHDSWGGDVYSSLMLGSIVLLLNFLDREKNQVDKSEIDYK
ncbi:MAG: cyanoexosortase B [Xenococcaceae cyanobacterium MO_188.B19]|nr:cyanoexosortase B [Xenococcaceae cyanobacterium MO_188.B19]